jgi:hypothetical protein
VTITAIAISGHCADLRRLLPAAAAALAEPDADGTAGGGQPGTRPPWNAAAAGALMDAHEGVRRLEASLRRDVTGRTGPRRGGSDANTDAAIKAIEQLGHAVGDDAAADAGRILERWSRRIRELPAVDESQPWRKMPGVTCPYCNFPMLWVQARAGRVACLRGGACFDADGRPPAGRLDVSRLTGDPLIMWNDGLVTP